MKNIASAICLFLLFACNTARNPDINELLETDRQFSKYSELMGYAAAFIEFAHPDVVLLRDNQMPVVGKNSLIQLFQNREPENVSFTWNPLGGSIANSGELGYTYGVYVVISDSATEKGTYVSIWKKDKEGRWKCILDSGNQGIGED